MKPLKNTMLACDRMLEIRLVAVSLVETVVALEREMLATATLVALNFPGPLQAFEKLTFLHSDRPNRFAMTKAGVGHPTNDRCKSV